MSVLSILLCGAVAHMKPGVDVMMLYLLLEHLAQTNLAIRLAVLLPGNQTRLNHKNAMEVLI